MNLNDVVTESKKTWSPKSGINASDQDTELLYVATCLGGEVGELQNKIKKHFRNKYYSSGHAPEKELREVAGEEIADILYYVSRLAELLNVDMEKEFSAKMKENVARYVGKNR